MSDPLPKSVVYHFRTRGTGAEGVHIAGIANALEKLGYHIRFVSPTGVDPRKSAGENPFQQKTKKSLASRILAKCPDVCFELLEIGYNFFAWRKIAAALREKGCEFIYERHAFFLCATALLAQGRNIPLVIEVNELVGDQRIRKQPLLSFIARWTDKISFRRASLIIVVSPHLKRRIESYGIAPERILVLPNAVAAEDHAEVHDGRPVREKLRLTKDHVLIGFIGWFVEWHRLDLFLKVFARVHKTLPNTRLALVGEGKLKQELEAQVAREKLEDAVFFVNAVPHHEVPRYIAAFDIAVVPHSNDYRSPIKLFEYMAEAKVVVAPRTEPIEMVISEGRNGILFEPLSEEGFVSTLEQLAKDPAKRAQFGTEARKNVLERYTWVANATQLLRRLKNNS
ncbi:MAG: hypothetical protein JWM68_251 [Verrucomicrobiales bacterium]|nr:hypothetical protein [Verrucomicrobiales bacterium]